MAQGKVLLLVLMLYAVEESFGHAYTVPRAQIDVFHPKGFRVCIPHEEGIQLFAFHGSINKVLPDLAAGDYSKDVIRSQNGFWCFVDTAKQLKFGDVINYWTYVQLDGRGYRKDDQNFTVTQFTDTPNGYEKHDTSYEKHDPLTPEDSNATNANTTLLNPPQALGSGHQCGFLLTELNRNLDKLHEQIENLSTMNKRLLRELHLIEMQNSKKALVARGLNASNQDPRHVLSELIIQKLALSANKFHITKIEILADGSIIFEMNTRTEKNRILSRANANQRILENIKIEDIKTVPKENASEMSAVDDEEFTLDVRAGTSN